MATDIYAHLAQDESDLSDAASGLPAQTEAAAPGREPCSKFSQLVCQAVGMGDGFAKSPPAGSCQQSLVLSFFFDGTGNNIDTDSTTDQQSNIARLYESHRLISPQEGLYAFYCYGIGTYFKESGDPGGTPAGLGMGDGGKRRLEWAFDKFDETLHAAEMRAKNPTNKILSVRIAVFGFSRGATLARAFVRDLQERCVLKDGRYLLKQGGYPVEVYFLGLFDTVALVGMHATGHDPRPLPHRHHRQLPGTVRAVGRSQPAVWRTRGGSCAG